MSTAMALEETSGLLLHEAHCLDSRKWDEWLELYTEDAVFWVPAWKDEEHQTDNPDREVSMMYYGQRARLAERVWRARSGQSIASAPLPRTMHSVTNIVLGH
jgi:3-phenylpropionate/cinnamic acid dioxygenase small subunit